MCIVVICNRLRLLTDVEPSRAMSTFQPGASDLVAMNVAQSLAVKDVREVSHWITGIDDDPGWYCAHASSVQDRQLWRPRSDRTVHRPIELEEDVRRVVDLVRPRLADRALSSARPMFTTHKVEAVGQ